MELSSLMAPILGVRWSASWWAWFYSCDHCPEVRSLRRKEANSRRHPCPVYSGVLGGALRLAD